jgi:2'-5' RNA ligase
MRCFLAIPLPELLQHELARFQARARQSCPASSWPEPRGLHLTLAFLGEKAEVVIPALLDVVLRTTVRHRIFGLKTSHLGGFPKARSARVLWLGLEEQPALVALAEDLRQGLREADMTFDDKPFRAHLTVARFRTPQDVAGIQEPPAPMEFEAREVVLYQSLQGPAGSRYQSLGTVPLKTG